MNERGAAQWIVLKFGGTSVSSLANWRNIAQVANAAARAGRACAHRAFRRQRHH